MDPGKVAAIFLLSKSMVDISSHAGQSSLFLVMASMDVKPAAKHTRLSVRDIFVAWQIWIKRLFFILTSISQHGSIFGHNTATPHGMCPGQLYPNLFYIPHIAVLFVVRTEKVEPVPKNMGFAVRNIFVKRLKRVKGHGPVRQGTA